MNVSLCEINTFEQAWPLMLEGFVQTTSTWICRLRRLHFRGLQAGHCISSIGKMLKGTERYLHAFMHHTAIHAAVSAHKLMIIAAILSTLALTTGSSCTPNEVENHRASRRKHAKMTTTRETLLIRQSGVTRLFLSLAHTASKWCSSLHTLHFPAP